MQIAESYITFLRQQNSCIAFCRLQSSLFQKAEFINRLFIRHSECIVFSDIRIHIYNIFQAAEFMYRHSQISRFICRLSQISQYICIAFIIEYHQGIVFLYQTAEFIYIYGLWQAGNFKYPLSQMA